MDKIKSFFTNIFTKIKTNFKKRPLAFIIPVAVIIVLIIVISIVRTVNKIPKNDDTVTGNSAANLVQGGLFCEDDDKVYFINTYDSNHLYKMDKNCENIEMISDDSCKCLNVAGDYIYYVRDNAAGKDITVIYSTELYGVVRMKKDGSAKTTLYSGISDSLALSANTLIYNAGTTELTTKTISIRGKDDTAIAEGGQDNGSLHGGILYYADTTTTHAIYSMDIETGKSTLLYDVNAYKCIYYDGSLYFSDMDSDYALTRINMNTGEKTVIVNERVINFNIYNGYIYFQSETGTHALKRINTFGEGLITICEGDISTISCTEKYVFIQFFGSTAYYRFATFADNPEVAPFFADAD